MTPASGPLSGRHPVATLRRNSTIGNHVISSNHNSVTFASNISSSIPMTTVMHDRVLNQITPSRTLGSIMVGGGKKKNSVSAASVAMFDGEATEAQDYCVNTEAQDKKTEIKSAAAKKRHQTSIRAEVAGTTEAEEAEFEFQQKE
jgi:deoxyhypusine synthase